MTGVPNHIQRRDGPRRVRLCVMLSGSGRTLLNLLEAIGDGRLAADVPLVIASRECLGAERARAAGIPTLVIKGEVPAHQLEQELLGTRIDVVVLAGYLKRVNVPRAYRGRVLNIHPSLLPKFGGHGMYGDNVHQAVIAAGERESGCTVHLVEGEYDTGRILLQRRCPVLPTDNAHSLADRVFQEECIAYPEALRAFVAHLGGSAPQDQVSG